MKTKSLLFIFLFTILVSCSNNSVFNRIDNLGESNQWAQADAKTYEFTIEDDTVLYDMSFLLIHVYDYQFASIPIHFDVENPNGKKETFTIDLPIKDESGKDLGDCVGDICDLNYKFKEKIKLPKGKYKITVSNQFEGPYLPNVISVGLEVDKVE